MKKRPRILVANRSEIACRIFQSCRELDCVPVGLLAPGDEEARHITMADEVIEVPSYLDAPAIVERAKKAKIDAVHPGYGFLSERGMFARALEQAGLVFIGPRPETMEHLGGKVAAKEMAEKEGVPTVQWAKLSAAELADGKRLETEASRVGFPVLIKASAGGGGKGMRLIRQASEVAEAAESASREAQSAFGDGTIFLERFVEKPRHVEVQIFGDGGGNAIHLFERECTLQRRHQKVVEEAPCAFISEKTRKDLTDAALKLARATKYRSAGTVEFLVAPDGSIYFLEVNTRLQVEHPVTEWVTGLDLVKEQLKLALDPKSYKLPAVTSPRGHAIEVRLYAEDASRGFVPSPGRVEKLIWPSGPGIRVDSGVEIGQSITTLFDPMIAKLSVFGEDRASAIRRMLYALGETVIHGVGTNQEYLTHILSNTAVQAGAVDTKFLERDFQFEPESAMEYAGESATAFLPSRGSPSAGTQKTENVRSPWFS